MIKQQSSGCVECATIWTLNHHQPPAECFSLHLAAVWHLPATLAGTQPSLRGPVVFRYFSWPVKFLTRMIDFGRQQQVHFQSNSQRTRSKSYNNHFSTAGLNGKNGGPTRHTFYWAVLKWFCLLPEEMFWSWTIVSTYQCWWSLVVELQ